MTGDDLPPVEMAVVDLMEVVDLADLVWPDGPPMSANLLPDRLAYIAKRAGLAEAAERRAARRRSIEHAAATGEQLTLPAPPERHRAVRHRLAAAVTALAVAGDRRAAKALSDAWRTNPGDLDQWDRHLNGVEAQLERRNGGCS